MKEAFIEKRFSEESAAMIVKINRILAEYARQNLNLTLRQLFYQLVSRDELPDSYYDRQTGSKNNIKSYKRIGDLVSNGRQAGQIDWEMIEDRGRSTVANSHWNNPSEMISVMAYGYHVDRWQNQPYHIEIMVEKDALSGVLHPVCGRMDVPLTANKGYSSSSTMYDIGKRLKRKADAGKKLCVFYLGDHDPSGLDMTRDVEDRLSTYSGKRVEVVRLALNWDQIKRWKPPENPVKMKDARSAGYGSQFGLACWELDAIEPVELSHIVERAILERRDPKLWAEMVRKEEMERHQLQAIADAYKRKVQGRDGPGTDPLKGKYD